MQTLLQERRFARGGKSRREMLCPQSWTSMHDNCYITLEPWRPIEPRALLGAMLARVRSAGVQPTMFGVSASLVLPPEVKRFAQGSAEFPACLIAIFRLLGDGRWYDPFDTFWEVRLN